jgi:hypothetical protein
MTEDDVDMTLRALRPLVAAIAVLALALPASGLAVPRGTSVDSGVVQSVGLGQIVLKALDGHSFTVNVSDATRVRLNGTRAAVTDIQQGFVATAFHDGTAPARLVIAFGRPALVTDRGFVTALTRSLITLRAVDGTTVSVPLDATTQFRPFGFARRFLSRPGTLVTVTHAVGGPAKVVNVLKRPGA